MVFLVFIFLLGLLVGSFLNLVIDRIPREEQILKGRSRCDSCGKILAWYDLIPLVSWIFLAGRCRYCHFPIPRRNVVVELSMGILFIFNHLTMQPFNHAIMATWLHGYMAEILTLFILSSLIAVFFIDLEHKIIPDRIVYPAIFMAGINGVMPASWRAVSMLSTVNLLLSAVGAAGFFLLLVLITKGRGMGMGDVKLAFLMGLFLGFPKVIYALYFAFLTGAIFGVILILLRRKKFGQTIAFGPFLVVGTLFAYFNVLNFIVEKIW